MNRQQFLLTKLAEEASEVAQMALKIQQFGKNEIKPGQTLTNEQRLHLELNDFYTIITLLRHEFGYDVSSNPDLIDSKLYKIQSFYNYSKGLGMVQDEKS